MDLIERVVSGPLAPMSPTGEQMGVSHPHFQEDGITDSILRPCPLARMAFNYMDLRYLQLVKEAEVG